MLVAGVICNALRGRGVGEHPGQLLCHFQIGIWIQMPIGPQGRLYFFMPQALFNQQRAFSHADE